MGVALVVLTPLYVFWSRTFMIESTALFFSLLYATETLRLASNSRLSAVNLFGLFMTGALAALIKATTVLPLFLVIGIVLTYRLYKAHTERRATKSLILLLVVQMAIFAVLLAWVTYSDVLKSMSPLGERLSSKNLRAWNFGTLDQRLDPEMWNELGGHVLSIYFPLPEQWAGLKTFGGIFLGVFFGFCLICCDRLRRIQVACLLGLFLLPCVIFFNLYVVHNYYENANAVFLSLAMGLALSGALETASTIRRVLLKGVYVMVLAAFMAGSIVHFQVTTAEPVGLLNLTRYLQGSTAPKSVIVIGGGDWSSMIPYYAQRKALMLTFIGGGTTMDTLEESLRRLLVSGEELGAYVDCGSGYSINQMIAKHLSIERAPDSIVSGCRIFQFGPR